MFDYAKQTQILAWVALCQTGVEHGAGGGVQQETNHTHVRNQAEQVNRNWLINSMNINKISGEIQNCNW